MKNLLIGSVLVVVVVVGGLAYRNAVEHPSLPIACPLDAQMCPDGTSVTRTGTSCTFAVCPLPNISLANLSISFALPAGFEAVQNPEAPAIATYALTSAASSTATAQITIRSYPITASSTALATIQKTAIGGASDMPVSATAFTSTTLGNHRFTVVTIERFEGTVDTAYYLARASDVLRFDAIDTGVVNWTDSNLDVSKLSAHSALSKLLITLQGQ